MLGVIEHALRVNQHQYCPGHVVGHVTLCILSTLDLHLGMCRCAVTCQPGSSSGLASQAARCLSGAKAQRKEAPAQAATLPTAMHYHLQRLLAVPVKQTQQVSAL